MSHNLGLLKSSIALERLLFEFVDLHHERSLRGVYVPKISLCLLRRPTEMWPYCDGRRAAGLKEQLCGSSHLRLPRHTDNQSSVPLQSDYGAGSGHIILMMMVA